jgi:hypothetical protein
MAIRTTLAVSALALAAGFSNLALAQDVRTTDPQTFEHWYGRAGGLTGSERIAGLAAGNRPLGITYDQDVAARTNMSTDRATGGGVGVVYDEDVATRTNMQRSTSKSVVAAQPGRQTN